MSVEPIHIKLEAAGEPPSSFPVVLKKIMEMPPPNILDGDDGKKRNRRRESVKKKERERERELKQLKRKSRDNAISCHHFIFFSFN